MIEEYYKWILRLCFSKSKIKDLSKGLRFNQRFKKVHLVKHIFGDIYSNRQINRKELLIDLLVF